MDDSQPHAKRRKVAKEMVTNDSTSGSSITSSRELQRLLKGSDGSDARTGIQSFKEFLQSIGAAENTARAGKLQVLKTFCEGQTPKKSGASSHLPDLIATWTSTVDSKNEALLSAIPSVLALLLKVISTELDFREFGLGLCKDVLQKDQLRLLERGLTATKTKEHLISPCIRLLTEIVSFDGGALAGLVYSRRETTWKRLDLFLAQRKVDGEEKERGSKRPSLRRIAQRYVIANLKYQTAPGKSELITQGTTIKAFLQGIRYDESDIIIEILEGLDRDVIKDPSLSRNLKHRFLTYSNLNAVATLYSFEDHTSEDLTAKVQEQAHKFLRLVCTSQGDGILRRQTGWYPYGSSPEAQSADGHQDEYIDLGLDSLSAVDKYADKLPLKNAQLSGFLQTLRPENPPQAELLLDVFKAAPELVADYFFKKSTFPVDPKPTPQWLGYSALIFSAIQLPIPEHCGWKGDLPLMPPPTSVVVENVLPRPLDKATLTRCLNLNHEIVTLFAIRALSAAFTKLGGVLNVYKSAPEAGRSLWQQASEKLTEVFGQRCPSMKDVIAAYNRTSKSEPSLHAAVVDLLAFYYKYLPDMALAEKFDVSIALVDVLSKIDSDDDAAERQELLSQLTNLLEIAQRSTDTRWWNKPESLAFSPFTSLLRIMATSKDESSTNKQMHSLLTDICLEHGTLCSKTALDALLASFRTSNDEMTPDTFFQAIDQSVTRLVRRPVQYLDFVAQLRPGHEPHNGISLLAATLTEQYPFLVQTMGETSCLKWLNQLFNNLHVVGEDKLVLESLRQHIVEGGSDLSGKTISSKLSKTAKKLFTSPAEPWTPKQQSPDSAVNLSKPKSSSTEIKVSAEDIPHSAFPTPDTTINTSSIQKALKQDPEEALTTGTITSLITCLQSPEPEIRRQSFVSLERFTHKLPTSSLNGWQSYYLLLGSLTETLRSLSLLDSTTTIPSILTSLSTLILPILSDPLHPLFQKVSLFLNKSPLWIPATLPAYWVDAVLMTEPTSDIDPVAHIIESNFLLTLLVNSLRNSADLEIYRRAQVFERVLSWSSSRNNFLANTNTSDSTSSSTLSSRNLQNRILELLHLAIQHDGQMTMITRTGILSYLDIIISFSSTSSAADASISTSQSLIDGKTSTLNIAKALKQKVLDSVSGHNEGWEIEGEDEAMDVDGNESGKPTRKGMKKEDFEKWTGGIQISNPSLPLLAAS